MVASSPFIKPLVKKNGKNAGKGEIKVRISLVDYHTSICPTLIHAFAILHDTYLHDTHICVSVCKLVMPRPVS